MNRYLLGSYESRNTDPPPFPGPTLSDYYLPDIDRHRSGLHCFEQDHLRMLSERDHDLEARQHRQDNLDILTDSESDDEQGYIAPPVTIEKARLLSRVTAVVDVIPAVVEDTTGNKKGKAASKSVKAPKGAEAVAAAAALEAATAAAAALAEEEALAAANAADDIKEDQVELLRDRKIMELSASINANRCEDSMNATTRFVDGCAMCCSFLFFYLFFHFYILMSRLMQLSRASVCLLQALPLQMPFHTYEEDVYKTMESRMPTLLKSYVQNNVATNLSSSQTMLA